MPRLQAWHILVLIIAVVLLFGWKRLPDAARSLGQSMRIFKSEVEQMRDHDAPSAASTDTVAGSRLDPRVSEADRLQAEADRLRAEAHADTPHRSPGSTAPPPGDPRA